MKLLSVVPRNLTLYLREVRSELLLDALRYEIDLPVLERRFEFSLDPILIDEDFLDLALLEDRSGIGYRESARRSLSP